MLSSPIAFGQTVVDKRPALTAGEPNCLVAEKVDRERYLEIVLRCLEAFKKEEK